MKHLVTLLKSAMQIKLIAQPKIILGKLLNRVPLLPFESVRDRLNATIVHSINTAIQTTENNQRLKTKSKKASAF